VRDGQVMRPVGGGDGIFGAQMCADPRGDRLLASREVHLPGNQTRAYVEGRFLVGVVREPDRLFVRPDQDYRAQ
jgi:hypothetical protein